MDLVTSTMVTPKSHRTAQPVVAVAFRAEQHRALSHVTGCLTKKTLSTRGKTYGRVGVSAYRRVVGV